MGDDAVGGQKPFELGAKVLGVHAFFRTKDATARDRPSTCRRGAVVPCRMRGTSRPGPSSAARWCTVCASGSLRDGMAGAAEVDAGRLP